jgi:hypothetical protein
MSKVYNRAKAEQERQIFVEKWCKDNGLEARLRENFEKASMEWAKQNSKF